MSDDALFSRISALAERVRGLHEEAVAQYGPVVEAMLRCGSRDVREIEHTLDGPLDFCGHAPALVLYRRLCRHYFEIDPAGAAYYVQAYRDWYDEEGTSFGGRADGRVENVGTEWK